MMQGRRYHLNRLLVGLALLACCSSGPPPVGGLLASPAGMALANSLLFLANQDGNELHVFDTLQRQFRPSPNLMFPVSVPTVRRPGAVCGDARQMFTLSTVDPTLGVIDAFDDPGNADPADPPLGLRELGQLTLPGVASDAVCTQSPSAVLSHEIAVAGSAAQYAAEVDTGVLLIDSSDGDGGLGERHAIAALPVVALLTINDPDTLCQSGACNGTQIWEAGNDLFGVSCDGGTGHAFCPSLQPLLTLTPQPAGLCAPVGPPLALRVDASGANAGDTNLGVPNVDPATINRLMASDRNSNCVASVDLNDLSVNWLFANGPSTAVYAMPFLPTSASSRTSCWPGGDLFAAVFDHENCERYFGPPPVGGYPSCDGVSFLSARGGGLLPEPLPYPFTPRHAMPPVRIFDLVQKVTFIGPNVEVGFFPGAPANPVPIAALAMVGTGSGNIVFVDIGMGGRIDGGTGPADDGGFTCPAAYLAPRLFDVNDYTANPIGPQISQVAVATVDGGTNLGAVTVVGLTNALTADGGVLPASDRLGQSFVTPAGSNGLPLDLVTCYGIPSGAQLCVTGGLVQKGVAQNETFVVTFEGPVSGFFAAAGDLSGATLQIPGAGDLTQADEGLLVTEGADGGNLTVELSNGSGACGDYSITAVSAGALTLNPPPTCAPGSVTATIVASGRKPFTVQGTSTGILNQLWPMDGTLHLVTGSRWHYPADLIGMLRGAEQLADLVFGPIIPTSAAPGSSVSFPRDDGADSAALDSPFGLALVGPLGTTVEADGGVDGGLVFIPTPGATWSFNVSNGVLPLVVSPNQGADALTFDSLIDSMAAYTDTDGGLSGGVAHVYATYRGGNALVELAPTIANSQSLAVFH